MRLSLTLSLIPLATFVGALKVVEPKEGATIDPSKSLDVKWTSVDTDASNFNIYLVNSQVYPPVNKKVASNIKTSKDSYTIDNLDATAGHGYQINLVSDADMNSGILAQSHQFNVTESAQSSKTSSTSTSDSTSASTSTSTGTTGTSVVSTETAGTLITTATKATASASGLASNSSSSATPTPSTGAGASLVANPILAGFFAGAFALTL